MSPVYFTFLPLAVMLFVIALVAGTVFVGIAIVRGQGRAPLAFLVVAAVLLLAFLMVGRHEAVSFSAVDVAAPPASAQTTEPARPVAARVPAAGSSKYPIWTLDESNPDWRENWKASPQQSMDDAVALIAVELGDYLRSQQPPIEWTPPPAFVESLVKRTVKLREKQLADAPGTKKYRYEGSIELTPALRAEILRHDREFRSQQRMVWLGLIVAGIVGLLGVVAFYVHMDEMTKGYYTGWLRVAAVSFLGGIALVLLLIA